MCGNFKIAKISQTLLIMIPLPRNYDNYFSFYFSTTVLSYNNNIQVVPNKKINKEKVSIFYILFYLILLYCTLYLCKYKVGMY